MASWKSALQRVSCSASLLLLIIACASHFPESVEAAGSSSGSWRLMRRTGLFAGDAPREGEAAASSPKVEDGGQQAEAKAEVRPDGRVAVAPGAQPSGNLTPVPALDANNTSISTPISEETRLPAVARNADDAAVMPWALRGEAEGTGGPNGSSSSSELDEAGAWDFYDKLHRETENIRGEDGNATFDSPELTSWAVLFRTNEDKGWKAFREFREQKFQKVRSWKLQPKSATSTDRLAVLHFATDDISNETLDDHEFATRTTMHQLGSEWGLQIFFTKKEHADMLDARLGSPENIVWSQVQHDGIPLTRTNHQMMSYIRMSDEHWNAIHSNNEHVLIFEHDALLLRANNCVDPWLNYDYVGAPWANWTGFPKRGGNSGFSLRRLSAMKEVLKSGFLHQWRGNWELAKKSLTPNEDRIVTASMLDLEKNLPNQEEERCFAVETIACDNPCAFHKPWAWMGVAMLEKLLSTADF